MKISKLYVYKDKGKKGIGTDKLQLIENKGIEGDRFARGGDRQVSVIDRRLLNAIEKNPDRFGVCAGRIKSNIVTEGCRVAGLRTGDRLVIGDAVLEITDEIRPCVDDCPVAEDGIACQIKYGTLFAKVVKSGEIHENDTFEIRIKTQQ